MCMCTCTYLYLHRNVPMHEHTHTKLFFVFWEWYPLVIVWIQFFYVDPGDSGSYSGCVLVLTLYPFDKMPQASAFKKEQFIMAHGFRGFSPWSLGAIALGFNRAVHHGEITLQRRSVSFLMTGYQSEKERRSWGPFSIMLCSQRLLIHCWLPRSEIITQKLY